MPYINWRDIKIIARTQFGARFHCLVKDRIQSHIIYFGIWEPNLTAFIQRRLNPGDVFVDVGANIGYFTALASKLVGAQGSVFAIEASPSIYSQLTENIELNGGCANIYPVNVAASDEDGTVNIYSGPPTNIGLTSIHKSRATEFEDKVTKRPLDEILGEKAVSQCRLVKIDVEGAELPILRNIISTIHKYRNDVEFIVEISPQSIEGSDTSTEKVFAQFKQLGFFPYALHNDYHPKSYLHPQPIEVPKRIEEPPKTQMDVVFSRQDINAL